MNINQVMLTNVQRLIVSEVVSDEEFYKDFEVGDELKIVTFPEAINEYDRLFGIAYRLIRVRDQEQKTISSSQLSGIHKNLLIEGIDFEEEPLESSIIT